MPLAGHTAAAAGALSRPPPCVRAAAQVVPSSCRATVGQVAGGGRTEKPMLKAGRAYHKYRVKRNSWPKVRSAQAGPGGRAGRRLAARRALSGRRRVPVWVLRAASWRAGVAAAAAQPAAAEAEGAPAVPAGPPTRPAPPPPTPHPPPRRSAVWP